MRQHNTTQHNYRPKEYKSHKELRYITDKEQHLEEINAAFCCQEKGVL